MNQNGYIGKTCPYCKTPLTENDTVVFCNTCDMPHHLSCWQANQGCTTFGCTGQIKEVIRPEAPPVMAQPAAPAAPATPVPPSESNPSTNQKPIETLYESKDLVFLKDCPIALENTALIIDRRRDKLFARCIFRSITDKPITAVLIEIACQDVWGADLGDPVPFQYLDLHTGRDSQFGQTNPIELPNKTARKIQIAVKKILFADGTIGSGGDVAMVMPAPIPLNQHLQNKNLVAEYARETTPKAMYVPQYTDDYWRCTCGSVNDGANEACQSCGCTKEVLTSALNLEALNAKLEQRLAAEEQARLEQAERIRRAEEEVRQEQEKQKAWMEFQQEDELRKQKRKKTIIITIAAVVSLLAICSFVLFYGIPNARYQEACEALDNGDYDEAYYLFWDLGNFKDSEVMVQECLYQEATAALNNQEFEEAHELFIYLGDYSNSAEMALETRYQQAVALMNSQKLDDAIQMFSVLGNYSDSSTQILEAKYRKADHYQNAKKYKEAYQLYVELGDYKESQSEVLSTIMLWEAHALGSSTTTAAFTFSETVKLSSSQYEMFYSTILLYLDAHDDALYWHDGWYGTAASKNVKIMLKMLPSSYKDTSTLLKLFNLLATDYDYVGYEDLFCENETLMRQCWSLGFVQDMAEQDVAITYFLRGYWTTYYDDYYISFIERSDGGTNTEYTLPWISEPSGTKYFDIRNMTYIYTNADHKELAKVYRFEIVDYDTIKVYCYKNNRTYTLYR